MIRLSEFIPKGGGRNLLARGWIITGVNPLTGNAFESIRTWCVEAEIRLRFGLGGRSIRSGMVMNTVQVEFADGCDLLCRAELKAIFRKGVFIPGAIQPDFHPDRETVYGNRLVTFVVWICSECPSH
jgi:hypothetical protein